MEPRVAEMNLVVLSRTRATLRRGANGPVVREVRRRNGLAVDGIVGRLTWGKPLG